MDNFASEIKNCEGYTILEYLPWNNSSSTELMPEDQEGGVLRPVWGFIICCPPKTGMLVTNPDLSSLYGTTGIIQGGFIQEPCLGFQLAEIDQKKALSILSLACSLSILDSGGFEIGDTMVVTGVNALSLNLIGSGSLQGLKTVCLVPDSETKSTYLSAIKKIADKVINFQLAVSFDDEFTDILKSACGKVAYVDTAGVPNLINYLATKLDIFGQLILCRRDSESHFPVDIYRDLHKKSVKLHYWTLIENQMDGQKMLNLSKRAGNLIEYRRVSGFY